MYTIQQNKKGMKNVLEMLTTYDGFLLFAGIRHTTCRLIVSTVEELTRIFVDKTASL